MPKKISTENFIKRAIICHGNLYSYDKSIYVSAKSKIIIVCKIHGEFKQTPDSHLKCGGCPNCKFEYLSRLHRSNNKDFIDKANNIHKYKYIYSKINYINAHIKIIIICKIHGEFKQTPNSHLNGQGCAQCSGKIKGTNSSFIKKAINIHKNKYDYSKISYIDHKKKVIIICPKHGEFKQSPLNHLSGNGCKKCVGKNIIDLNSFIQKSIFVHKNKYDYSDVIYVNTKNKVIIICPIHGKFYQSPAAHVIGKGCSSCSHIISKPEQEWIKSFNNINIIPHYKLVVGNKFYKVDGFDSTTNTVYEYYGSFWHGNPKFYKSNDINRANKKTYGELYIKTINRQKELEKLGYNIISEWSDF